MTARDVMDFPEPDSPTRPSTLPWAIEKERSRTARNPVEGLVAMVARAVALEATMPLDRDPGELEF